MYYLWEWNSKAADLLANTLNVKVIFPVLSNRS
jgi:hypothetical protein